MNKLFEMEDIDQIEQASMPLQTKLKVETAVGKANFETKLNFENELNQLNKNFISDQVFCKYNFHSFHYLI
jgi:hypothetical protein